MREYLIPAETNNLWTPSAASLPSRSGSVILGAVLLLSIFVQRDAGIAPQLIPSSPLFGSPHGPGGNGAKPTFPIGWTHGMNVFFGQFLHIEPDIWGTIVGMVVIVGARSCGRR